MAESNPTQVILTDDGLKIIKAQSTANNAASGVTNLNDPNLMSVIEKQTQASQYAGLTSQYKVILNRAKDVNINTTDLTTAYNNLNNFMAAILTDTTKASDVDRYTYKILTDAYNTALSNVQNTLSNNFNTDISNMRSSVSTASQAASSAATVASQAAATGNSASQTASSAASAASQAKSAASSAVSVANSASQAASSAVLAGSQAAAKGDEALSAANQAQSSANNAANVANSAKSAADSAYDYANSEITVQSNAIAKAQSAADGAFSQAVTAIDNDKATSQAVTDLKDGSTMTIAQLQNGLATKVANSDYATYKTQTANQIGQMVTNSTFSAYQKTTADLISARVATSDFSTYKDQTAAAISSKVDNGDFNTYKTQTANVLQTLVGKSPSNIIKDGGFNSAGVGQIPNGWVFYDTAQIAVNPVNTDLVATGRSVLQINSKTSGNSDTYYGDWFDVQPGDQFYGEFKAHWSSMSQKGQIVLGMVTKDAAGNLIWSAVASIGSPSNWAKYTGVLTIPSGAVQGKVWVAWQNSAAANQAVFVTDLVIRPAYSTQSDITQSINNIHLGIKNADGSTATFNMSGNTILMDTAQTIINGKTSILDGTISTAKIADAAISNAKIGSLAVDTTNIKDAAINSAKIANLAVGTAQIGDGAITNAKIANLAVGTAQIANAAITDAQVGNVSANKLTAGTIDFNTITGKNINASNITTGKLSTNRLDVDKLSAVSANLGDVTTGSLKGVDIVANSFSTPNGSFTTDANGAVVASNLTIRGVTNLVYNAALLGNNGSYIPGWSISNNGVCWANNLHDGVPSIGFNADTGAGVWANFAQTKLHPLNGATGQPFSASVWFKEYGSDTSLIWNLTLAFFDSNGNRINGGYHDQGLNGIGSEQDWRYVTINNAVAPSNAVSVGLQYFAYNGHGNGCFSSPMLTQTAQSTGYQPDTGNVVSAGEIDGSVINGSTINGGTLNMQNDGLINSPYTGIRQTADQFYHPWKLNTGQLTIGQGYITSVSSGTRSINGVPKKFNSLQGTLSASYLKFTNDYNARTYIDADMFTYSNQTNDTAIVVIDAGGIGINMGTMNTPALTIYNGYIDASSSSSYGKFGALTLGYDPHTINSDSSLFFESGHGSGNPGINIWAKGFQSMSSRLSTKRQVRLLDDEHSNSLLLGADTATFQYNQDTNADNSNEGVIIDDVNTVKQYNLPDELITRDGKAPTDLMSFIARVISQNKYQARLIEDLQIRLRKVEIKNE